MLRTARPGAGASLTLLLICLGLAACGTAAPTKPAAERVCQGAVRVTSRLHGGAITARISSRDPANISCVLGGPGRLRISIVAQTGDQAYTEFDTETSHQDQVYGPGIHEPGQIPQGINVAGAVAAVWIPAPREVVATNAQPDHGGTYVTVTVSGAPPASARSIARTITGATLAAHLGHS